MSTPEGGHGRKWLKPAVLATGIAAMAAWCGAEKIAEKMVGEPVMPPKPSAPQKVKAERGPMQVGIGFDVTRSDIRHDLPNVTAVTRQFLQNNGVLKPGDQVIVCTFAEGADCNSFTLPDDAAALAAEVDGIKPQDPRRGMQTHVHHAIAQMVNTLGVTKEGVLLAWTDGKDDEKGDKTPLASGHSPVVIVVPQRSYVTDAKSVEETLGDTGVDVALAEDSGAFGALLEKFSRALDGRAQARAQADEDLAYEGRVSKFQQLMAAYEDAKANADQLRGANLAKIAAFKFNVKAGIALLLAALGALIGFDYRERNKPQTKGFLSYSRDGYPKLFRLPESAKPCEVRLQGSTYLFTPTKTGLVVNGRIINDGDELAPGITYTVDKPKK
jgi:hypothetical protein